MLAVIQTKGWKKFTNTLINNTFKLNRNLFLVCPECFIEQKIRAVYGNYSYFLTALGSVFNIDSFEYAEEINNFITKEEVYNIYVVNDIYCTFIQNTLTPAKSHKTNTEQNLAQLYLDNLDYIEDKNNDKAITLATLNINNQINKIKNLPLLNYKIDKNEVSIKGLIYNRANNKFIEI